MNASEPVARAAIPATLTDRLAAAERALVARDKTIQALVSREKDRASNRQSPMDVMEENSGLQEVVTRKTWELEEQNLKLEHTTHALRQSEELMRLQTAALESAANGVAISDSKGILLWINRAFTQLTGYSADEAIGHKTSILKSGHHPESFYKEMWQAISQGRVWKGEMINRHKSGRLYHEEMTITPIRDAGGTATHFIAIKQDISERKRAEEELRASQNRLQLLLTTTPVVIYSLRADGDVVRTTFISPNVIDVVGYGPEAFMADPGFWFAQLHPDDTRVTAASFSRLSPPGSTTREYRFRQQDGSYRWMRDEMCTARDSGGETREFVGYWIDITARKQAEAELEEIHKQLLEASRRSGMAEIATNVLHNVGNVLNSVNISCSVIADNVRKSRVGSVTKIASMLDEHADDLAAFFTSNPTGQKLPDFLGKLANRLAEEQEEQLREIQSLARNIDHIKDIVAMQQSYAKVSGVTEIINVIDLVEDSLRMNADALERHAVQVVRDYAEVPPITVEKHKALQILVNLIRNAKHACEDSGHADREVTLRVAGGTDCIRVSVIDNGVGIPRENLTRIFAHGFTTKAEGHGFGLHSGALAAREMGGSLTVHSDGPGNGATFILELPLNTQPPHPSPPIA